VGIESPTSRINRMFIGADLLSKPMVCEPEMNVVANAAVIACIEGNCDQIQPNKTSPQRDVTVMARRAVLPWSYN